MYRGTVLTLGLATVLALGRPGFAAPPAAPPKIAPSRVVGVTVYPNNALVTREVDVPEGTGSFELVVNPLPPQTVNSSLYSEGTDGTRVLTTRYRMRPIQEDTREEVRKVEEQLRQLQAAAQKLQSEVRVCEQNMQLLTKLENFTSANLQPLTEKGLVNGDAIMALAKYVMDGRAEKSQALVTLQQQLQDNKEKTDFTQRKRQELSAGSNHTERDAVIVVDKKDSAAGKVRLHYLVDAASWRPQYKFRAGKGSEPVQVEYLAAVVQQTGEDWRDVNLVLSTAQPMLNAAPPELKTLEVAVAPRLPAGPGQQFASPGMPGMMGGMGGAGRAAGAMQQPPPAELAKKAKQLRLEAQQFYNFNSIEMGGRTINEAAALEQTRDLLAKDEDFKNQAKAGEPEHGEGPSVTYHLDTPLSVPSRNDEQVIEVAKIEMKPDYYYKAVPVLTRHVYRLANLTNKSSYVLLPGEATMYIGKDFVGRTNMPLVAIGEQFTAGFGVDPQLQVQRQLLDKTRSTQGDNQVIKFEYRILLSSYKTEPAAVQLWDRLPHAESEIVGVNLLKAEPKLSGDALYLREERPRNLLRWDLKVDPSMIGEKALAVNYEFKMELGRQMRISNFSVNANEVGFPLPAKAPAPRP
jgi:hypothetical protein